MVTCPRTLIKLPVGRSFLATSTSFWMAGLRLEQFVEDEVVLVAGTNPAFCKYQQLAASVTTAQDLCQLPLIWRESGCGTRTVVEAALRKLGMKLSLSPAFETSRRPSSATLTIARAVSFTSS